MIASATLHHAQICCAPCASAEHRVQNERMNEVLQREHVESCRWREGGERVWRVRYLPVRLFPRTRVSGQSNKEGAVAPKCFRASLARHMVWEGAGRPAWTTLSRMCSSADAHGRPG